MFFHLGCFQLQAVKPTTQKLVKNEGNSSVCVKRSTSFRKDSAASDWAPFVCVPHQLLLTPGGWRP